MVLENSQSCSSDVEANQGINVKHLSTDLSLDTSSPVAIEFRVIAGPQKAPVSGRKIQIQALQLPSMRLPIFLLKKQVIAKLQFW